MNHTPGRLTVHMEDSDGWPLLMVGGPAGRIVANVNAESGVDTAKAPSIAFKKMPAEANARRLAACWNAADGIPTEELEAAADGRLLNIFEGLIRDRDELLEALELIANTGMDAKQCMEAARAAIARVKGGV